MAIHIHLHPRQVDKTKDAGFGKQVEYDPRAVSRLKSDIAAEKLLLSKKKMGQQEQFCLSWNGKVVPAGIAMYFNIEWTEE